MPSFSITQTIQVRDLKIFKEIELEIKLKLMRYYYKTQIAY